MPWHVARTNKREHQACFYLTRAGIRSFWPVRHEYFIDSRTKIERFKIKPQLVNGYVFVELLNDDDRAAALSAIGVASLLGSWTDEGYRLATIRDSYVTDLIDHGPVIENKRNTRGRFKPGQKVKLALTAISEIIAEYEGLDSKGRAIVKVETLGKLCSTTVDESRLTAAD